MILYRDYPGTGATLSPLDLVYTAVVAHLDWDVKKVEYDAVDNYINVLWVEAMNTTNGDRMALTLSWTRGGSLVVRACEYIDLVELEADQPNRALSGFSTSLEHIKHRGAYRALIEDIVIIDKDYLYLNFAGYEPKTRYISTTIPYPVGCFVSTIEKSISFTKGIVFGTNSKTGNSYKEVFYNGEWYGDSIITSSNNLQSRLNTTYPSAMYSVGSAVGSAYFYNSISIHVNLSTLANDTDLILLGHLPGGLLTTTDHYKTVQGLKLTLAEGGFIGYPDFALENSNILLFPTT